MPAPLPTDTRRITLANGLSVVLCHDSRFKRSAASLRTAGSHDVPQAWPGLAHFLEHLFFLGTERFPAGENLMTFVQRHGGQLNASTRERTTDFFFELPQAALRARPGAPARMAIADQRREREVLHAEFIAWLGDVEAQKQIRLLAPINPQHPLRGFHAGNRYSLSVPNPAFQQALNDFYTRFYQAGQMTLCLTGPQSLTELEALAENHGALFACGKKLRQRPPPPLVTHSPDHQQTSTQHTLLFACEDLPAQAGEAVAFLCHWMNNTQPGGLVAGLADRGLAESLNATPLYQFEGQLLLVVEFKGALANTARVSSVLCNWLEFFKTHWPALVDEYQRLQQRRLCRYEPLALAHHHCHELPAQLSAHGATALSILLEQLMSDALIDPPTVDNSDNYHIDWRLPSPNPFLNSTLNDSAEAALYLRWALPSPQPALWERLNANLKDLIENARQAGVTVTFSAYGAFWQLQLHGLRAPMADILAHGLLRLHLLQPETLRPETQPALIPIRQLLKRLADHYLSSVPEQPVGDLQAVWADSRWISFTRGWCPASQLRINAGTWTPRPEPTATPPHRHCQPYSPANAGRLKRRPLQKTPCWCFVLHRASQPKTRPRGVCLGTCCRHRSIKNCGRIAAGLRGVQRHQANRRAHRVAVRRSIAYLQRQTTVSAHRGLHRRTAGYRPERRPARANLCPVSSVRPCEPARATARRAAVAGVPGIKTIRRKRCEKLCQIWIHTRCWPPLID